MKMNTIANVAGWMSGRCSQFNRSHHGSSKVSHHGGDGGVVTLVLVVFVTLVPFPSWNSIRIAPSSSKLSHDLIQGGSVRSEILGRHFDERSRPETEILGDLGADPTTHHVRLDLGQLALDLGFLLKK